jgi:biotin transport system substrate-specific component
MSYDSDSVALVPDRTIARLATAAALAALTGVLAQFSIPLPGFPAPISFQVIPVYLAGLLLGPVWGGGAILLYLLAGTLGAPVFSNMGAGLGYVLGPTGGYLIGFLLAAVVIGAIVHRAIEPRALSAVSIPVQVIAMVVGLAIIYAVGVPWLAKVAGYELSHAVIIGAAIFLPGDILKILAVLGLITGGTRLQSR